MDQFELLTSVDQLPEGCDPSTILCTLYGPFADYSKPTGNGYWYSGELYDKMLSSPQYQEFMSNGVNFAEGDHPSDQEDRSSVYLPKVSHAYRDVVNDKANQRVMGKIDILDTPDGRVLYTLVKYGAKLGVSSRGEGDLIVKTQDGSKIATKYNDDGYLVKIDAYGNEKPISQTDRIEVDPDTYLFYAWDIVHQPSNEKARMDMLVDRKKPKNLNESKNSDKTLLPLFESLKGNRQGLKEATEVVLGSELREKKLISKKLNEYVDMLSGDEDNDRSALIAQLQNDLKESVSQYLQLQEEYNKLKAEFDLTKRLESVIDKLNTPVQQLEPVIGLTDESQTLQTLVESQGDEIMSRLEEIYTNVADPIYSILNNISKVVQTRQDEREIARQYYDRVVQQYDGLEKSISAIEVPETIKVDQSSISYLSSQYSQILDKISSLELDLHNLSESQKSVPVEIVPKNRLSENKRYLDARCSQLGLDSKKVEAFNPNLSTMTFDEIDEALSDIYGQSQYTIGPIQPIIPDESAKTKITAGLKSRRSPTQINESLMRVIRGNADIGPDDN